MYIWFILYLGIFVKIVELGHEAFDDSPSMCTHGIIST